MPYKKKKGGNEERPPIVQWLNKENDRYQKIERSSGIVISEKVTSGPYKNFEIVKRRPARRKVASAPKPPTNITKKQIKKAVSKTKKSTEKKSTKKKSTKKKSTKKKSTKKKTPKKKKYLNNKDLLIEVIQSKQQDKMSEKLARMLQMLCARYGSRGQYSGYTYNEDMQAYAMMMLVRTWRSFNPEKSQNPFAFFTQCVKNSFIQYLNSEKRHRTLRDELMVDNGLNPSYTYQLEHEQKNEDRKFDLQENLEQPETKKESDNELVE